MNLSLDLIKWIAGGAGSALVFVIALTWRTGMKAGAIDQQLGLLAQIKDKADRIPQLEQTIGMLVEHNKKFHSDYPKFAHSIERRVAKLEWVNDVVPTGVYSLVPPDDKNGAE